MATQLLAIDDSSDDEYYDAVQSLDGEAEVAPVTPVLEVIVKPSLAELLKDVPPEKLDQPCRHNHLCEIALSVTDWQSIAPFLGLTEAEVEEIERDLTTTKAQKTGMLGKWRRKFGREAKYRTLAKVFSKLDRADLVEDLCKLLLIQSSSPCGHDLSVAERIQANTLDSYADYLRGRYSTELPAFFTLQWPPRPTRKVFKLAIIEHQTIQRGPINEELVRLTLRGGVDDIMRRKTAVQLENIFSSHQSGRKVILIEGAPGAGKSTLAWHICQKWESGELFQEFNVVVFVQLRDPAVQAATFLSDILPARSSDMRTELLSIKQADDGRGVLFVLDGWDEYGPGLHRGSLFWNIICKPEDLNMNLSSLIITSRPIASGELQEYASSRIEIVGFTSAEVKKYFSESIGDTETEQKLQDHLREHPVIEASCYLPLNAAIVVHLFLALNHTLPHTLHEVFQSLVLCCIIRHLTKEAEGGRPRISSLDDLPPDVQEPFKNICIMAYHGVMENKATFSASDLRSFNLPTEISTLSLIRGVQNFTAFEQTVSYNFLHLSVQELLAAFHVSKLSATDQIRIFNDLFDQPRLAAVFQFYAAFTKLQTEGVRDIVARIVQKQKKLLLVNLLHGLYEAQDPSLCQFVASHLKGRLDLSRNTLSPIDCLVVGYFLSCVCLTTSGEFKVDLSGCSLDDYRASFLIRELSKCSSSTDARTTTGDEVPGRLAMDLRRNQLSGHGITCSSLLRVMNVITMVDLAGDDHLSDLTSLMKVNCFPHLKLTGNQLADSDIVLISDSLKTNTILKRISVARCGISEEGCKAIGDALMVNRFLQVLDLHDNPISTGVVHIAESLKHNHSLLKINLGYCGISEKGGKAIGDALMVNRSLQVLDLHDNLISADVVHIAESLKHNHSLLEIYLSNCGVSEKGGKSIGDALMVNRSLQVLDLCGNQISVGVVHIAESLKCNHSLLLLNLICCGISKKGGKAISDVLMVNRSLQVLDLRLNPISTAVAHIAESLKCNHSLLLLNLICCRISQEGGKAIGEALMVNRSLQVLDLQRNPISVGVVHIAESLKHNHSLLEINLGYCSISEKGAESLADGLRHNNCLKRLGISQCGLRDRGMKSIGSALEVNNSLEELNVTWNGAVTGIGLLALGESLKRNRGLRTLRIKFNDYISDSDWKLFKLCLQENNHLRRKNNLPLIYLELSSREEVVRQEMTTLNDIKKERNLPPLKTVWV